MTFCFDLDGTLCTNTEGRYEQAIPFSEVIAQVNAIREQGHHVIIFTARGSGTGIDWRETTERQLAAWGVRYDRLQFGKPAADVYIDDKAVNIVEFRLARLGAASAESVPAMLSVPVAQTIGKG